MGDAVHRCRLLSLVLHQLLLLKQQSGDLLLLGSLGKPSRRLRRDALRSRWWTDGIATCYWSLHLGLLCQCRCLWLNRGRRGAIESRLLCLV